VTKLELYTKWAFTYKANLATVVAERTTHSKRTVLSSWYRTIFERNSRIFSDKMTTLNPIIPGNANGLFLKELTHTPGKGLPV
jgi:hypothetical protein